MRTAKTLSRLGGCPGLSESSLGANSFCWFCHVVAHMSEQADVTWRNPQYVIDISLDVIHTG